MTTLIKFEVLKIQLFTLFASISKFNKESYLFLLLELLMMNLNIL